MSYQTVTKHIPVERCGFAYSGTYGHECGAPAVKVAVFHLGKQDGGNGRWDGDVFYSGRCESCATIKGGENAGAVKIEALDGHVNRLVHVQWVADVAPRGWEAV